MSTNPNRIDSDSQPSGSSDPGRTGLNVEQRLAYLRKQFSADPEDDQSSNDQAKKPRGLKAFTGKKLLKTAVALAVAAFIVWLPAQRLLQTTSVEAVVNAQLVTLRSPIDGVVSTSASALALGSDIAAGADVLRITNSRAERGRLDDLRRQVDRSEAEEGALTGRLGNMKQMHAEFVEQTILFQKGRILQLEARVEESNGALAAAKLRQQEAEAVLDRARSLDTKGFQPKAMLDKAQRDSEIAAQDAISIVQRIRGITIELDAARNGTFLGDSYNDRPRSSQRADELKQIVFDLSAQLTEKQAANLQLRNDLTVEQMRQGMNAGANVVAPTTGKIWEVLTTPGEQVQRGQELVRMVDCRAAVVTAVVSESVYNQLQVGANASFRFRDSDQVLPGRIVNLTGVATAPANFAIAPSSLSREAYRVVVSVPDLVKSGQACGIGRTGQVVFDKHAPVATEAVVAK